MKLLFKLLILINTLGAQAFCSEIMIMYKDPKHLEQVAIITQIFAENYHIPRELIHHKHSSDCQSEDIRFLEICLDENKDLFEIEKLKKEEIKQSLLTFSQTSEGYNAY